MATKRFWVVMGTDGLSHSPFRHVTEEGAFAEAERLSRKSFGTFFVLEAKGATRRIEVQTEKFSNDDEIPF